MCSRKISFLGLIQAAGFLALILAAAAIVIGISYGRDNGPPDVLAGIAAFMLAQALVVQPRAKNSNLWNRWDRAFFIAGFAALGILILYSLLAAAIGAAAGVIVCTVYMTISRVVGKGSVKKGQ